MRIRSRVLPILAAAAAVSAFPAAAQQARSASDGVAQIRDERFKWFIGAQGGALLFGTQSQTQSGVPAAGAHLGIIARRAGLLINVEEGFGSDEPTAFIESFTGDERDVTFDRIRRYSFTLTGYPVRGSAQPYLGVGFGITHVINPQVGGFFTGADEAAFLAEEAKERSSSGFVQFLAGVQVRVGRISAFGQYQIGSSPAGDRLLRGPTHSLMGGLRFSLGNAKEEIKGGGY